MDLIQEKTEGIGVAECLLAPHWSQPTARASAAIEVADLAVFACQVGQATYTTSCMDPRRPLFSQRQAIFLFFFLFAPCPCGTLRSARLSVRSGQKTTTRRASDSQSWRSKQAIAPRKRVRRGSLDREHSASASGEEGRS